MNLMPDLNEDSKTVVIITGGLIMQTFDESLQCFIPNKNPKEVLKSIGHDIDMDKLEVVEFSVVDSCTINLEFLSKLAKLVQRKVNMEYVNGVVIIFGSDTMEIAAYFLHRCIYPNLKSIVITGSMRVISSSDYDGKANITNSIQQVSDPESMQFGYGVTINFAGKIHSPVHVTKEHSYAVDPFSSGSSGVIGVMHTNRIDWLNSPKRTKIIPLPDKLLSIPIIYAYPGASKDLLDNFINKFEAIVVVAYGSGNVSENMYYAMKNAIENELKIVLVTNCKYGGVFSEYGGIGGNGSLKDLGVIMADDLNPYQAMIVASLVFNNKKIPKDTNLQNFFTNKGFFQ